MAGNALGALKTAALRIGLGIEEYRERVQAGLKWCTACKEWHDRSTFPVDRSRGDGRRAKCLAADRGQRAGQSRYPNQDKARAVCRAAVLAGRLPRPNSLPCLDCGHRWTPGGRRHEYDHVLGYAPEHRLDVEPVCTLCHADREKKRRAA